MTEDDKNKNINETQDAPAGISQAMKSLLLSQAMTPKKRVLIEELPNITETKEQRESPKTHEEEAELQGLKRNDICGSSNGNEQNIVKQKPTKNKNSCSDDFNEGASNAQDDDSSVSLDVIDLVRKQVTSAVTTPECSNVKEEIEEVYTEDVIDFKDIEN